MTKVLDCADRATCFYSKKVMPQALTATLAHFKQQGRMAFAQIKPGGKKRIPAAAGDDGVDRDRQFADDIIAILAGINWEQQAPDDITRKIAPTHPFRPVAEAVSLIKMDIDQLLREQKVTEKELFESREKYKNILNSIEEGYYENDLSGNLTFFNDSLCKILNYTRDELQGINYREISDKDYLQVIYETFNRVYTTGIPAKELDWKLTRKDGSVRFVEMPDLSSADLNTLIKEYLQSPEHNLLLTHPPSLTITAAPDSSPHQPSTSLKS